MTATDLDTTYDPFDVSSGLPDDFDFQINEAFFATDAAYNEGNTILLHLVGTTDLADRPQETIKLSIGANFEIVENGARVVRERGNQQFNKNSRAGQFLIAAVQAGAGEAMRANANSPLCAAAWVGLNLHLKRVEVEGFDGTKREVLLPTGLDAAGGSAPATSSNGNGSAPTSGVDAALKAKLTAAAKAADDYASFIDAAFAIEGVEGNTDAETLVTTEEWFNEARG